MFQDEPFLAYANNSYGFWNASQQLDENRHAYGHIVSFWNLLFSLELSLKGLIMKNTKSLLIGHELKNLRVKCANYFNFTEREKKAIDFWDPYYSGSGGFKYPNPNYEANYFPHDFSILSRLVQRILEEVYVDNGHWEFKLSKELVGLEHIPE